MDISQENYVVLLIIAAVAVLVMGLVFLRLRQRNAAPRIEPGQGIVTAVQSPLAKPDIQAAAAVPDLTPTPTPAVTIESEPSDRVSDHGLERGYRGFRISLREKHPGLWVASISDAAARSRKKSAEGRKLSTTREYYQLPAALAEAKIMIDRLSRFGARH